MSISKLASYQPCSVGITMSKHRIRLTNSKSENTIKARYFSSKCSAFAPLIRVAIVAATVEGYSMPCVESIAPYQWNPIMSSGQWLLRNGSKTDSTSDHQVMCQRIGSAQGSGLEILVATYRSRFDINKPFMKKCEGPRSGNRKVIYA